MIFFLLNYLMKSCTTMNRNFQTGKSKNFTTARGNREQISLKNTQIERKKSICVFCNLSKWSKPKAYKIASRRHVPTFYLRIKTLSKFSINFNRTKCTSSALILKYYIISQRKKNVFDLISRAVLISLHYLWDAIFD